MLSTTSEHALRALVHLARLPDGASSLGRDLARQADIPPNYLSKILWALRNAGIVETTRGQGGGYRLARRPVEVFLIDVVEPFERIRSRPGCLLGEKHECDDESACTAHTAWKAVRQTYLDFLTTKTIADVAGHVQPPSQGTVARNQECLESANGPSGRPKE
jgi:Rrf2 family protein